MKTIVTTELIKKIADKNNIEMLDCYTGFKWIAREIRLREGKQKYIGGGEESYGFLAEDFVRDKDAVSACCLIAEVAAWAKDNGKSLYQLLLDIYVEYGFSKEFTVNVVKPGKSGAEEIKAMMENFRANPPKELGGSKVILSKDYKTLKQTDDKGNVTAIDMPEPSNVLQYFTEDGSKVSVRPSGTEPKIKFYIGTQGDSEADAQAKCEKFEKAINEKTKAVIVNTPNNPTGVIYHEETMKKMAEILEKKEKEIGHEIYLISDEPYRELVYDGNQEDFLTKYYRNTIVGYSFSKSLSLPGERIGYVVVPDEVENADQVIDGIVVSNRTLGFVNAPSLLQKAVAKCLDEKTNLAFYDENRKMLYEGLQKLGFHCIKPEGAFYMWVKSPDADEEKFVAAGKKYNIIMVKGSAFGCAGYVRLAYCVSHETVKNALTAFEKLAEDYGLYTE